MELKSATTLSGVEDSINVLQHATSIEAFFSSKDQLSCRELQVLELLGRGLSGKGIGRELQISLGTVKWHLKNIYAKLNAGSREQALSKARARNIVP